MWSWNRWAGRRRGRLGVRWAMEWVKVWLIRQARRTCLQGWWTPLLRSSCKCHAGRFLIDCWNLSLLPPRRRQAVLHDVLSVVLSSPASVAFESDRPSLDDLAERGSCGHASKPVGSRPFELCVSWRTRLTSGRGQQSWDCRVRCPRRSSEAHRVGRMGQDLLERQ